MPMMTAGQANLSDAAAREVGFVAQVVGHMDDHVPTLWALDSQRSYRAYGFSAADWSIGEIVHCVLSEDGRYVGELTRADDATKEAFKSKRLIP